MKMETTTTTRNIENKYMNGVFMDVIVTLDNGRKRTISVFIGTIDYVKRDNVAGHPRTQGYLENYTRIFWAERFVVENADAVPDKRIIKFDDVETAVGYYFNLDSDHKVLRQVRVLVDGTEDTNTIDYRWA